ncbi:polysaccharide biosynthesis tyrosine autokinase [Plantactinospora endophytica]|uniref:Chromosome partitioning protein n=1 Tax=Plantactinospora endophytica TaxID=673535 RepID=A0ABQ4DXX4_9ACTN|nr:polysaccharide biosynthesis tyrosine autokinase [Plantactinospora endophytica]GIG87304.1 chromosome partitioning protein [Plantactinospora endophytica]
MDLHAYLRALRQRWWVVLATVMVALGLAGFVTVRATPQYASSVTFFVTSSGHGMTDAYQGSLFLQQRVKSYVDLLSSDRLAQTVAAEERVGLTADEVRSRVSARVEADTVLLSATVTDSDQARALRLTEALAAHFVKLVHTIETPPGAKDPPIKIEVVGGPRVNAEPVSPRPVRNLVLAGVFGLVLGAALSVLRGLTDTTFRDGETLQEATSAPLLGSIPYDGHARSNPLIVGTAAQTARAEAMRKLRTNLRFVDAQEPARVIAVTSAVQAEGKSTLACNLAITLAEAGWQVLLVDADLRRPRVAGYLGIGSGAGLTDVLIGEVTVEDVLQPWGDKSLLVLPGGSVPPNPSELLGSKAMADLLLSLRDLTDIVIIDTPPLLAFTDGVVVAVQADGALLVARQGKTPSAQTAAAAQALHSVSARVLGCVLNMSKENKIDVEQYRAYRKGAPVETVLAARGEESSAALPVRIPPKDAVVAAPADNTEELDRVPR